MKSGKSAPPAMLVPAKWQRHYQSLKALRESLLEDHAERTSRLVVTLEPAGSDAPDSASEEIRQAMTLGILTYEDNAIFEIDAAIARMKDGSFGICQMTGEPIPDNRLRVVPWTRYTKEALQRIEREGETARPLVDSFRRRRPVPMRRIALGMNPLNRCLVMVPA